MKLAPLLFAILLTACASMETAKSFNEQLAYVDAGLDGVLSSVASQYQAGTITKDVKDKVLVQVQNALEALKTAKSLNVANQPNDALKALQAAQVIVTELQAQLGVKK